MGLGPIPRSIIRRYASDELDLWGDEHDAFCITIRMIDDEYLAMQNSSARPDDKVRSVIDPKDAKGVAALLGRLGKKPKSKKATH